MLMIVFRKKIKYTACIGTLCMALISLQSLAKTTLPSQVITNTGGNTDIMKQITLEKANAIIEAAFIESKKLSLQPMSVVILDAGGHIIAFQRQDKAAILRFDIAFAKAYGALGMGIGSRGLALKAKEIPELIHGAVAASKGRLIPAPGGVLIVNRDNDIIGAAGASGDTSDNDEHTVIAGIQSVGLKPKND
jgi:uncharacterized protein GlcG (DUF336 family)